MGLQKVTNKVATQNATEAKPDKGVENALKVDNDSLKAVHKAILSSGIMITKSVDKLGDILMGNDLQKAEDQQEMIEILKGLRPSKTKDSKDSKGVDKPKGIFDWLKDMLGSLANIPIISWFTAGIKALWTTLVNTIAPALVGAGGFLLGFLGGFFKQHGLDFEKAFLAVKKGILNLFPDFLKVGKDDGIIAKAITKFENALTSVKSLFKEEGVFAKIGTYFTKLKGTFTKFFKLGEVFGKIFAPIEAVYYTIMGAFDEWKKVADEGVGTQILGALKGAGKGALEWLLSLPATLIDLVKDWVISPLLKLFGADEIAKSLGNFSFVDTAKILIDELFIAVGSLGEWIGGIITKVMDIFTWDSNSGIINNITKYALKLFLLPEQLVAIVGDFIKDFIVAPIFSMFGKDDIAEDLKKVSLLETLNKTIDSVVNFFGNIVSWIGDKLIAFDSFANKAIGTLFDYIGKALMDVISIPSKILDFIKDRVVIPLLNLFGADEMAKSLAKFSFTESIKSLIDDVFSFFLKIKDWVGDQISNISGFFGLFSSDKKDNNKMEGAYRDILSKRLKANEGQADAIKKSQDETQALARNAGIAEEELLQLRKDTNIELIKANGRVKPNSEITKEQKPNSEITKEQKLIDYQAKDKYDVAMIRHRAHPELYPLPNTSGAMMNATKNATLDAQSSAPMVVAIAGGSNSSPSSANVNATSIQVAGSTHREGGLNIFGAVRE